MIQNLHFDKLLKKIWILIKTNEIDIKSTLNIQGVKTSILSLLG